LPLRTVIVFLLGLHYTLPPIAEALQAENLQAVLTALARHRARYALTLELVKEFVKPAGIRFRDMGES
jgi:hypothetical protein